MIDVYLFVKVFQSRIDFEFFLEFFGCFFYIFFTIKDSIHPLTNKIVFAFLGAAKI